jgi:phosphoribosylaminoimidazole-succinocarboxamide synthase
MRAGEGKKHGRLFVCDGAVDPKTSRLWDKSEVATRAPRLP